jgi:predicted N-acetyltransferase YhbS
MKLTASVGWDYGEPDFHTILSSGTIYGHKNEQGEVVSSAAIFPYGETLASIGMVIVNEHCRGYGLGRELTEACIQSTADDVTIMLIATEEGRKLYEKLGFHAVTTVHKYLCEHYTPLDLGYDMEYVILPLTEAHFEQVRALDRNSVGADRGEFLQARIRQAKQAVVVTDQKGSLKGYGLSIEGPSNLILGPIVAADDHTAARILQELAFEHRRRLRIDVPDGQEYFMHHLEQTGFIKTTQPPVMIRNAAQLPRRNDTLYGIAAQAFG